MRIEIVSMIYRSVRYLDHTIDQLERYSYGIPWRIVANDPTPEVGRRLAESGAPYAVYFDPHPEDFYLKRVYRCINWYYGNSQADAIIETQSDMAHSPGWAEALIRAYADDKIPVSRLIHPFEVVNAYNIERDFGFAGNFREDEWLQFASSVREKIEKPRGLYCPRMMEVEWFLDRGGFPEGNLDESGEIADELGERAADEYFFAQSGKRHVTVFDSVVYHMGEGELRDK